jgi:hypothetical protein
MTKRRFGIITLMIAFALLIILPTGCGRSANVPSLEDIPLYPNATEGESMEQSSPGGLSGGKMQQYTTTDSFDDVVAFYTDALSAQNPEVMSHTSELGRQTAMSIKQDNGMITVAIQEFTEEGTVNITFMTVGS